MPSPGLRSAMSIALLCAALPASASAQIYSWKDTDGSLVVSTTPRAGAMKTYAVATAGSAVRSTTPAAAGRARRYAGLIAEYAAAHDVRPALVAAVIQAESAFNPFARSHKGAMGLMQLMPATATELGVVDPYDPEQNIRGGVTYLKQLLEQYSGNEELALAAYNAGPAAVKKYGAVPPYRETRTYIARIRNQADVRERPAAVRRKVAVVDGREVVTLSNRASGR